MPHAERISTAKSASAALRGEGAKERSRATRTSTLRRSCRTLASPSQPQEKPVCLREVDSAVDEEEEAVTAADEAGSVEVVSRSSLALCTLRAFQDGTASTRGSTGRRPNPKWNRRTPVTSQAVSLSPADELDDRIPPCRQCLRN